MEDKRLRELLKQRALVEGHLQWIDSEIESLQPAPTASPQAHQSSSNRLESLESQATDPVALPEHSTVPGTEPNPNVAISDIYDELGPNTREAVNDARLGCISIFACAFLTLGLVSLWIWYKY